MKEQELISLTHQLQSERMLSEEERTRLINEIAFRESQVAEMRSEVDVKTSEANKLQREVDEARSRHVNHNYHNSLQEHNGLDDLTNAHVGR